MVTDTVWATAHYKVPLLLISNNMTSWFNDEKHQFKIANNLGGRWNGTYAEGPSER